MPVSTSAKKALRNQARKAKVNQRVRSVLRTTLKEYAKMQTADTLPQVYRAIDIASKHKLIHKNKAARLKSQAMRAKAQG